MRRYAVGGWRHRWIAVALAWAICIAGWIAVSLIPNTYEATARLYVDADQVLTPLLKGLALDVHAATTAWRSYFGLEIDPISESFVVLLNPEGTRLLRSWRHVEHCPQCGGDRTAELSLDELRSASLA